MGAWVKIGEYPDALCRVADCEGRREQEECYPNNPIAYEPL